MTDFNHHFRGATIMGAVLRNMAAQGRTIPTALDHQLFEVTLQLFDEHAARPMADFVVQDGDDKRDVAVPISPTLVAVAEAIRQPANDAAPAQEAAE